MKATTLCLALLSIGCNGLIGDPGATPGEDGSPIDDEGLDPTAIDHCDPTAAPDADLLRVSRTVYLNALEAVFGTDAIEAVRPTVESLPGARAGIFGSEVPPPTFAEVSAYVDVANELAYELTKDGPSMEALLPCLTTLGAGVDPAADGCLGELVDHYGERLLRGPVSPEDRARFLDGYTIGAEHSPAEGVATLLMTMLLDPRFLYFLEVEGEEIAPGVARLTPHEMAARLARILWASVPDEELLAAADAGLDDEMLATQLARMWDDPRAREAMSGFYGELFELDNLPEPSSVVAETSAERNELRAAMKEELLAFTVGLTFERDGTYRDLLLDRSATVSSPLLAELYGVSTGEVELPASERAGVLTRAGWLATPAVPSSNAGHIIKRGHRLSRFLCQEPPPPDPDLFPPDDPADPAGAESTIRERFQAATAQPQCTSCHTLLDSFGGPFGHFGASGQHIDAEVIFAADGATTELTIDTASTVRLDGEGASVSDSSALSEAIAESKDGATCFARQLGRNAFGRELHTADACIVQSARDVLYDPDAEPGSIRDAIHALLTSDAFRTRSLPRSE